MGSHSDQGADGRTTREYFHPDVDRLSITFCPGGMQTAVVQSGNRAAAVQYRGGGDLAQHLDQLCAMVTKP